MTENEKATQNEVTKMGGLMFAGAWVVIFVGLLAYFSGFLDRKYNPNRSPDSIISESGIAVVLKRNSMGHYVTSGTINGHDVVFLLDTGATSVSIGAHLAEKLNLYPQGRQMVQTANGSLIVATTVVDELTVGEIKLKGVAANLNPGMQSDKILLGMSALKHLEWTQRGDQLTLKSM